MYPIWEISSVVYFQQMSTLDSKNYKDLMYSIFVVLTNMEQQPKSKPWNKKRRLRKFAIIISKFMRKSTNGLILALTTSEEQLLSGILK